MLIKTKKNSEISEQQVTDENLYHSRRSVLKQLGFLGAGSLLAQSASASPLDFFSSKKDVVFQQPSIKLSKGQ